MYNGWGCDWFRRTITVVAIGGVVALVVLAFLGYANKPANPSPNVELTHVVKPIDERKVQLQTAYPTLDDEAAVYCATHLTDKEVAKVVLIQHVKLRIE